MSFWKVMQRYVSTQLSHKIDSQFVFFMFFQNMLQLSFVHFIFRDSSLHLLTFLLKFQRFDKFYLQWLRRSKGSIRFIILIFYFPHRDNFQIQSKLLNYQKPLKRQHEGLIIFDLILEFFLKILKSAYKKENKTKLIKNMIQENIDINSQQFQPNGKTVLKSEKSFSHKAKSSLSQDHVSGVQQKIASQKQGEQKSCWEKLKDKLPAFLQNLWNYLQCQTVFTEDEIQQLKRKKRNQEKEFSSQFSQIEETKSDLLKDLPHQTQTNSFQIEKSQYGKPNFKGLIIKRKYGQYYYKSYFERKKNFGYSDETIQEERELQIKIKNKNCWEEFKRFICCRGGNQMDQIQEKQIGSEDTVSDYKKFDQDPFRKNKESQENIFIYNTQEIDLEIEKQEIIVRKNVGKKKRMKNIALGEDFDSFENKNQMKNENKTQDFIKTRKKFYEKQQNIEPLGFEIQNNEKKTFQQKQQNQKKTSEKIEKQENRIVGEKKYNSEKTIEPTILFNNEHGEQIVVQLDQEPHIPEQINIKPKRKKKNRATLFQIGDQNKEVCEKVHQEKEVVNFSNEESENKQDKVILEPTVIGEKVKKKKKRVDIFQQKDEYVEEIQTNINDADQTITMGKTKKKKKMRKNPFSEDYQNQIVIPEDDFQNIGKMEDIKMDSEQNNEVSIEENGKSIKKKKRKNITKLEDKNDFQVIEMNE